MFNKKTISAAILLAAFCMQSFTASAANSVGSFVGSVSGTVTDQNGVAHPATGSVDATVNISQVGNVITATITGRGAGSTGAAGPAGFAVDFTANYDAATNNLTGTYTDSGSATPRPISFTNTGGLSWSATITGTTPSASGPLAYTLTMPINLPSTAIFPGLTLPASIAFSGPLASTLNVTAQIGAPVNQPVTLTPVLSGSWSATAVPLANGTANVTGSVNGTLIGSTTITVFGQAIPVALNATFSGTLSTNANGGITFLGSWADGTHGGTMTFDVPVNPAGSITQFNANFSGGFSVASPLGAIPVTFTTTGIIPFVLN